MPGQPLPTRLRMIHPLDNLRAEHCLVARAGLALSGVATAVLAGVPFPAAETALLLRFLRDFVIAVHLHKEATWVWPAIVMRGEEAAAIAAGEVARLHEEATELIHSLILFWEPGTLSPAECEGFFATVQALQDRLKRMTRIEESILFPACEKVVPADDLLDWADNFAQLERERGRVSSWQRTLNDVMTHWAT